ncbi:MAG TPA: AAA family ATPase, partial [Thermoguttaceae bacterium]|nr:AAA family ATPase [Thermoguttaceae bacterium]
MQPLNVLIGPNGSGKSNLIEAINLLKALPSDVSVPFRSGGGIPEWLWKGVGRAIGSSGVGPDIQIDTVISYSSAENELPLMHSVYLGSVSHQVVLLYESITDRRKPVQDNIFFVRDIFDHGVSQLNVRENVMGADDTRPRQQRRLIRREDVGAQQSVLSQIKDADQYPEITYLGRVFSQIYVFRGTNLAHGSPLRGPQRADEPSSFLSEDGSNLGMVLNDLLNQPQTKKRLLAELKRFYEPVEDITTRIHAGTVETFFHERNFTQSVPSIRLSDGTLRYLCLLAILCHPTPPPLVCIEDP